MRLAHKAPQTPAPAAGTPSTNLLVAALSGLLGVTATGCDNGDAGSNDEADPCPDTDGGHESHGDDSHGDESHGDESTTGDPGTGGEGTGGDDSTSGGVGEDTDGGTTGGEDSDSGGGETGDDTDGGTGGDDGDADQRCEPIPEVTNEEDTTKTWAELREECAASGGYIQIHAACGGVNACAGYSVGNWDTAVRSDHTCRGMNGCNGMSCVFTAEDQGFEGQEVLELDSIPGGYPEPGGVGACNWCHAVYNDDGLDPTQFKVWVMPGSPRNAENWLDRSAAAQEKIVAFGSHLITEDGEAVGAMAGYGKHLSRAEIERVVAHIRTLTPVISEVELLQ